MVESLMAHLVLLGCYVTGIVFFKEQHSNTWIVDQPTSVDFFLRLSSGYSCSVCSYMYTHTLPTHAHFTHTTIHVQTVLQLHTEPKITSFSRSPDDSVGDGRVTLPLWFHA